MSDRNPQASQMAGEIIRATSRIRCIWPQEQEALSRINDRILDVGCGTGACTELAQICPRACRNGWIAIMFRARQACLGCKQGFRLRKEMLLTFSSRATVLIWSYADICFGGPLTKKIVINVDELCPGAGSICWSKIIRCFNDSEVFVDFGLMEQFVSVRIWDVI